MSSGRFMGFLAGGFLAISMGLTPIQADDAQPAGGLLARQAGTVLRKHCYRCHGQSKAIANLNVADTKLFVEPEMGENFVTRGNLQESPLWDAVADERMPPPEQNDRLSASEKQILKDWIEAGAPEFPLEAPRTFIPEVTVLKSIVNDIRDLKSDGETIAHVKYFSITHLHNNPLVSNEQLRVNRAALSKALNAMSRSSRITIPHAIDDAQTVFRVNLEDYGWDDFQLWKKVRDQYPYGMKYQAGDERKAYNDIESTFGDDFDSLAYMRADWFVATATRPQLYHELANIPNTLAELEQRMGVNVPEAFRKKQIRRAGMFNSGVSRQNRMVEYHTEARQMYWISYDFKKDTGKANLARFPLGPKFEGNPHLEQAFDYDGGEVIFEMDNGMHGYMLVTSDGKRIDKGPVEIVYDQRMTSGNPEIVNGLSCMNCHRHGLQPVKEDVRLGHALQQEVAVQKVEDLYAELSELEDIIQQNNEDYRKVLDKVLRPFLMQGEDASKSVTDFDDPVTLVTLDYDSSLTIETAASELYIPADQLAANLRLASFSKLGLKPLLPPDGKPGNPGYTIKRAFWGGVDAEVNSIIQEVAIQLSRVPIGR